VFDDDGKTFTRCPRCGQKVDPDGEGVRYAVELKRIDTMGGTDRIEGMGGYFHAGCAVPSGWLEKPKPPE
jgi:hypothetical protein